MKIINNPFYVYSKKSEDELESYYSFIGAEKFPILAKHVDEDTKCSIRRMFELLFKSELKEDADCSFAILIRKTNKEKTGTFLEMSVNEDGFNWLVQCPIDLTQEEKEEFLK